jgi:hypothetical protein
LMSSVCLDFLLEKEKMREKGMGDNYSLLYSMRSNMTVIESVLTMPPYVGSTSLSQKDTSVSIQKYQPLDMLARFIRNDNVCYQENTTYSM